MTEEIRPHDAAEIAAAKNLSSVATLWLFRLITSTLVAFQFAFAVQATGVGSLPQGDANLFVPGGMYLLEVLRIGMPYVISATKTGLCILTVMSVVELIPFAALLLALNYKSRLGIAWCWGRAIGHFPAFFMLAAITLAVQGVWLLGASLSFSILSSTFARIGERAPTLFGIVWSAVALLGAVLAGAVLDVCRAACVRHGLSGKAGLLHGLSTLRQRPLPVLFGWMPAAGVGLVAILLAFAMVHRMDVSRGGLTRLCAVFLTHQLATLLLCYARATWLARALKLVS